VCLCVCLCVPTTGFHTLNEPSGAGALADGYEGQHASEDEDFGNEGCGKAEGLDDAVDGVHAFGVMRNTTAFLRA